MRYVMGYIPTEEEAKERAKKTLSRMINWAKDQFELHKLHVDLEFSHRENARSFAHFHDGKCRIVVAIHPLLTCQVSGFTEYSRYRRSDTIGSFVTADWRLHLDAILAHEMAHIVQFKIGYSFYHPWRNRDENSEIYYRGLGEFENGHGKFFQKIYSKFRKRFINYRIFEEKKDKEIFDYYLETPSVLSEKDSPLKGTRVIIDGEAYEVLGLHKTNWKYKYLIKCLSTQYVYAAKLSELADNSSKIRALVEKGKV